MKKNSRFLAAVLAVILAFSLCACGKSASYSTPSSAYTNAGTANYAADAESYGFAASEAAMYDEPAAPEAPESSAPDKSPEKIIYSADVTLETTDFDASTAEVLKLVDTCGGYIESSSVSGQNMYNISRGYTSSRSADYTIRIPSQSFDSIMTSFAGLGNIPYSHTYTENVTAQYYDVQAHMNAYKVQEETLLDLMGKADNVSDILTIQDQLTEVRYRIESLQSTLNNWDRRVSYSTIYLEVREVREYTPDPDPSYGQRFLSALTGGFTGLIDWVSEFILWLVEALPTLIVLALAGWGIVKLFKLLFKKHKTRTPSEKKERKPLFRRKNKSTDKEPVNDGKDET